MNALIPLWTALLANEPGMAEEAAATLPERSALDSALVGIPIALVGMFVVFTGLVGISLAIANLPKVLEWIDSWSGNKEIELAPPSPAIEPPDSDELMIALAYVIHAEQMANETDVQKITIPIGPQSTPWSLSGKMRTLPRSN